MIETAFNEAKGDNLKAALEIIKGMGFETKIVGGNKVKVLAPNAERPAIMKQLRSTFEPAGYEFDPTFGSIGRLALFDRADGSVFISVKPDSSAGCAAQTGADYEEQKANYIKCKYEKSGIETETAGFGHGSDLVIQGPRGSMSVELKTASGADFGQFRVGYHIAGDRWVIMPTNGFEKNKALFSGLFDDYVAPYLNKNAKFSDPNNESLAQKNGVIYGLKRGQGTGDLRTELNSVWFEGRSDLIVPVDFVSIADYYASKGDEFIQIRGRGLYAFSTEDASQLGIPLFSGKGKKASVRFRIKPHGGYDGTHSFTTAIKLTVERSETDMDDDKDLDAIIQKLL